MFRNHGITRPSRQRDATDWALRDGRARLQLPADRHPGALGLSPARAARDRSCGGAGRSPRGTTRTSPRCRASRRPSAPGTRATPGTSSSCAAPRTACASTAAEVFRALRAENIGVNVHYIPVHRHPYYQAAGYPAPAAARRRGRLRAAAHPAALPGDDRRRRRRRRPRRRQGARHYAMSRDEGGGPVRARRGTACRERSVGRHRRRPGRRARPRAADA